MSVLLLGMFMFAPAHAAQVAASAVTTMSPAQVAQLSIVLANLKTTLDVTEAELKAGRIPDSARPALGMTLRQLSVVLVGLNGELANGPAPAGGVAETPAVPAAPVPPRAAVAPQPPAPASPPVAIAPTPPASPAAPAEPVGTAQALGTW
ncbi:MAG TPA: hypothetical protein VFU47_02950, partial [Armatimonadota bacterium]|nr:hypothetical protein [Armatimonadota bacterium]